MAVEYYWQLKLRDGTVYDIPPKAVEVVNKRMANRDAINLRTATIPYAQIESFEQTGKKHTDNKLLEEASRAFNEPILEGEDIRVKWVKSSVSRAKWDKHYSNIPGYRLLSSEGGMLEMAFKLPVHQINPLVTPVCTVDEVNIAMKKY